MNRKFFVFVFSICLLATAARAQQPAATGENTSSFPAEERRDDASFVSQTVPSRVQVEEIFPISIVMKNTGATTWDSSCALHTRGFWSILRISLAEGETVQPGSSKTFSISVTAPREPGKYSCQWQMVRSGPARRFGEPSRLVVVTVAASTTGNGAKFVSQTLPREMVKGVQYPVTITMRNTGTTTWSAKDGYALEFLPWRYSTLRAPDRVPLDLSDSIAPGREKKFSFTVEGSGVRVVVQWRMIQEGKQRFGEPTRTISVRPPAFRGNLDAANCSAIAGWAADSLDYAQHLKVALLADGAQFAFVTADRFRQDLAAAHNGKGDHSFEIRTPAFLLDGKAHSIAAFVVPSEDFQLLLSPKTITCAAAPGRARR